MVNEIIVGVLIILVFFGIRFGVKHFKGEGGCCGGGSSVKIKRKKLNNVIRERTFFIDGMTCENCKNRVESRLNEMAGVSAKVNLKKKMAVVSMEREISDEQLKKVIENAGYRVSAIQ